MLGESSVLASSGDVAAAAADEGGGVPNLGEEGERRFGGAASRWPQQESLALIKIRSEMGIAFRDSSVKGPLWEEVSRKLAELGYHRSAKKCREKFENVYKYHKRTKDGRSPTQHGGKSKAYRFFDQLEALDTSNSNPNSLLSLPPPPTMPPNLFSTGHVIASAPANTNLGAPPQPQQLSNNFSSIPPPPSANPNYDLPQAVSVDSTSSSTYSDQGLQLRHNEGEDKSKKDKKKRRKRKREWMEMFEKLMREVVKKQEELQKNLFDLIERRERERAIREEAWRLQEAARMDREREMLAYERSAAAAKDNAVISFLRRIADQQEKHSTPQKFRDGDAVMDDNAVNHGMSFSSLQQSTVQFSALVPPAAEAVERTTATPAVGINVELGQRVENGEKKPESSSRWPKVEVEALIRLRTGLDTKYVENAPKGPLWEEISSAMKKLGYNRNPKRCKEKWENINKYFKKVKESNKKRRDDSKTCPYFHQLDQIYREKNRNFLSFRPPEGNEGSSSTTPPLMVTPEQQWPPPPASSEQQMACSAGGDSDGNDDDGGERGEGQFEVVASKVG